ncbi:MAG: 2-oxoglutarate ferredoxin oxidoreductase subunit alpha [Planctomycetota bacterium]|nr:MAG: 2-oxoglutarate ferredoxin oxidoreductase subunit alpha [Planctomycetota bacterium]
MVVKKQELQEVEQVVIRFAGDSGDGMQTIGERFSESAIFAGNDIATFPDFPAEIRAPAGTLPGVSGYQIQFGSQEILTPGDAPDALVAMNPAALKTNLDALTDKGLLIVNEGAFTAANLKKASYESNPLDDEKLYEKYRVVKVDINTMTDKALEDTPLKPAGKAKCRNFFALGFVLWIYGRDLDVTMKWISEKWSGKELIIESNTSVLKAGYYFGETTEVGLTRYTVAKAPVENGTYRKITGSEAMVLGIVAASKKCDRNIVIGSYPITPATSILEGLAKLKNYGVKIVQAEDEIAAIGIALGAAFTGALAVTTTSGPGICLKSEFMGLACITELPLLVIDVQRGGPSTGLPTKTEQSDLLQVLFGRNGESPMPVVAASSPGDCFYATFEAIRIALKYRTPVVLLSDGYIANGAEPWQVPIAKDLPSIKIEEAPIDSDYIPYKRDPETLARQLAFPGDLGNQHRLGGLEKNHAGDVSYNPENHQEMTDIRAAKIAGISNDYDPLEIMGKKKGRVLIIGWGGTYGSIATAVGNLIHQGAPIGYVHLRHINPLPNDLGDIIKKYDYVLIPELNNGQLDMIIRSKYLVDTIGLNKVQGKPFTVAELESKIRSLL